MAASVPSMVRHPGAVVQARYAELRDKLIKMGTQSIYDTVPVLNIMTGQKVCGRPTWRMRSLCSHRLFSAISDPQAQPTRASHDGLLPPEGPGQDEGLRIRTRGEQKAQAQVPQGDRQSTPE